MSMGFYYKNSRYCTLENNNRKEKKFQKLFYPLCFNMTWWILLKILLKHANLLFRFYEDVWYMVFQFPKEIDEKPLLSMYSKCLKEQNTLLTSTTILSDIFSHSELIIISPNPIILHTSFLPPGISSIFANQKCIQLGFV